MQKVKEKTFHNIKVRLFENKCNGQISTVFPSKFKNKFLGKDNELLKKIDVKIKW